MFFDVTSVEEGLEQAKKIGYPVSLWPHYTLWGAGRSRVNNDEEMRHSLDVALSLSPVRTCSLKGESHGCS